MTILLFGTEPPPLTTFKDSFIFDLVRHVILGPYRNLDTPILGSLEVLRSLETLVCGFCSKKKTEKGIPSNYDNVYGLQYETYDPVYDGGLGLADYGRSISDLQPDDVFGAMGLADLAGAGDVSAQVALAGGGLSDLLSTIQGSLRL